MNTYKKGQLVRILSNRSGARPGDFGIYLETPNPDRVDKHRIYLQRTGKKAIFYTSEFEHVHVKL